MVCYPHLVNNEEKSRLSLGAFLYTRNTEPSWNQNVRSEKRKDIRPGIALSWYSSCPTCIKDQVPGWGGGAGYRLQHSRFIPGEKAAATGAGVPRHVAKE